MSSFPQTAAALCLAGAATLAVAAEPPEPQGVVRLASSASFEVTRDLLSVAFGTTREGTDAGMVQTQLKQALDAALNEAKRLAKPGQVDVRTGNFSLAPRYSNKGAVNGWQGSTELIVEGRDTQAIAQLTSKVQTLSIARVGFGLSREARQKVEGEVAAQAIAAFRARADAVSRQFGFAGYTVREVSVNGEMSSPGPQVQMRLSAARAGADEAALPVEAGKATVSATVSGTVQMK